MYVHPVAERSVTTLKHFFSETTSSHSHSPHPTTSSLKNLLYPPRLPPSRCSPPYHLFLPLNISVFLPVNISLQVCLAVRKTGPCEPDLTAHSFYICFNGHKPYVQWAGVLTTKILKLKGCEVKTAGEVLESLNCRVVNRRLYWAPRQRTALRVPALCTG